MKFCKTQVEIDIAVEKAVFLTQHKRSTDYTMHIEKSSTYWISSSPAEIRGFITFQNNLQRQM
jgi:hypothetical protein